MGKVYSARRAGEALGIPHLEVIRRIRKGDMGGRKLDWNYIITEDDIEAVRQSDWYKRYIERHSSGSSDVAAATT